MKYQSLFSGKNKKNISKCRLLTFFPRVLSIKIGMSACIEVSGAIFVNFVPKRNLFIVIIVGITSTSQFQ